MSVRTQPFVTTFGAFYDQLFRVIDVCYESVEVSEEIATAIFNTDVDETFIHLEHTDDDKLFAWRKEAWLVHADRVIRQKQEDNENRRVWNLRDEAIQKMAKAILNKTGRGKQFEEASVVAARRIIMKKDANLALLLGNVDLNSDEWKDLLK